LNIRYRDDPNILEVKQHRMRVYHIDQMEVSSIRTVFGNKTLDEKGQEVETFSLNVFFKTEELTVGRLGLLQMLSNDHGLKI
jgi:hypothetical protein